MYYKLRERLLDWIDDQRERLDVKGMREFYRKDQAEDVIECQKAGVSWMYTQPWFMNRFIQSPFYRLYVVLPKWLRVRWWDHAVWGAHRRKCNELTKS